MIQKDIEKNDVDISKLLNWGSELDFTDDNDKPLFKVWMRLVGDADVNRARIFALRKSAELRKKLRTEDTDERLALLPQLEFIDLEQLIESILLLNLNTLMSQAREKVDLKYPKEPESNSPLEDMEVYQKEVDEWPKKVEKAILSAYTKELEKERKKLQKEEKDTLSKQYESSLIDKYCEEEMLRQFQDMCIYLGTYKDKKYQTKFFKTVEEFQNLPTEIKAKFVELYSTLTLDFDELKK